LQTFKITLADGVEKNVAKIVAQTC